MQGRYDVNQRLGQIIYWDRFGSFVNDGGPSEFSSLRLWDVTSQTNAKPWNSSKIGQHSYKKLSVMNGRYVDGERGIYILEPYQSLSTNYGRINTGNPVYSSGPILEYDSNAVFEKALQKLLDEVRGEHSNLAVDLAEARKTIQMVRQALSFKKLAKDFFKSVVKHRSYKKIRPGPTQNQRRLKYVQDKWLEYRYGWLPLLSSIWSIGDALRKQHYLKYTYLKARSGSAKSKKTISGTDNYFDPLEVFEVQGSCRVEIGAFFALPTGFQVNDFTSLNPASIAWELVPFSFVADWFVGIGQCLENWENWFTYRNNFISGYVTSSYRETRVYQMSGVWQKDYVYAYSPYEGWYPVTGAYRRWKSQVVASTYVQMNRSVLTSLPAPGGPRVKVNLNSKRFLDAAALIGQVFRR